MTAHLRPVPAPAATDSTTGTDDPDHARTEQRKGPGRSLFVGCTCQPGYHVGAAAKGADHAYADFPHATALTEPPTEGFIPVTDDPAGRTPGPSEWEQVYLPPGAVVRDGMIYDEATGERYVGQKDQAAALGLTRPETITQYRATFGPTHAHPFPTHSAEDHARVGRTLLVRPTVLVAWDKAANPAAWQPASDGREVRRGGWPRGKRRGLRPTVADQAMCLCGHRGGLHRPSAGCLGDVGRGDAECPCLAFRATGGGEGA